MSPKKYSSKISSWSLQLLSLVLMGLAVVAYLLAEADGKIHIWIFSMHAIFQLGLMVAGAMCLRQISHKWEDPPFLMPLFLGVIVLSYVYELGVRWLYDEGHPFEFLVFCSLKNGMILLAAAGCWLRYQQLSVAATLFMILFSLTMAPIPAVTVISVIYAIFATIWLVLHYWESISRHIQTKHTFSKKFTIGACAIIVIVALLAGLGIKNQEVISALRGFMPSSGGTGDYDPFARSGVGDGDALVAGRENIQSFAPIEDAPFKSSEEQSLYDVFDDTYDEPFCPNKDKKRERAIPLSAQANLRILEQMAKSQKSTRTFTTLRQKVQKRKGGLKDLKSSALFYVSGRAPLHLRLQVYDLFDGEEWYPEPYTPKRNRSKIKTIGDKPWFMLPNIPSFYQEALTPTEYCSIKIINLKSDRIPAPPFSTRMHIDLLTDPSMYQFKQDSVLGLDRISIPELQSIRIAYRALNQKKIREVDIPDAQMKTAYHEVPQIPEMDEIGKLARDLTHSKETGWEKIDTLISYLKTNYTHDRSLLYQGKNHAAVHDFLFKHKRGGDYLFATAASMMIRSLGYQTRLVTGFYAHPEDFNPDSKHIDIKKDDVHVWLEVYRGANFWVTLEPTPGYEIQGPLPTWDERLVANVWSVIMWSYQNIYLILTTLLIAVTLYVIRNHLIDLCYQCDWVLNPSRSPRILIKKAARLIDYRLKWTGFSLKNGESFRRWLKHNPHLSKTQQEAFREFLPLADWASFSSEDSQGDTSGDPVDVARKTLQEFSYGKLRKIKRSQSRIVGS